MNNRTAVAELYSIGQRIERLPLTRFHRRFITLVSLGGWFDFYDIYMMAYIGAILQQSGFLSLHQFSQVIGAGFLGMFVGTIVFGMGSDHMGRRSAFITMLLIYSSFTLAGAFAPSAGWLIVLRFFAGIGIGALRGDASSPFRKRPASLPCPSPLFSFACSPRRISCSKAGAGS